MRVVTFATSRFSPFLRVWSSFPGISGSLDGVEVVAGDAGAEQTAGDVGISNTRRFDGDVGNVDTHNRRLRTFWTRRFEELVSRAVEDDMLHSDLDAFWLSDVRPEIEEMDFDLGFSVDHGSPPDALDIWGFALCCGLFATRANPSTTAFLSEWAEMVERMQHDQDAVNALLLSREVSWSPGPEGLLTTEIRVENRPVKIAVFPQRLAERAPPFSSPDTSVAHPFFEREFFGSFTGLYESLYAPSDGAPLGTGPVAANHRLFEDRFADSTNDDLWNLAALLAVLERDPDRVECAIHAAVLYERLGADTEAADLLAPLSLERLAQFPSAAVTLQRLSDRGLVSRERASVVSRSSSGNPRAVFQVGLGLARRGQLVSASLPISRALVSAGRQRVDSVVRRMARRLS